LIYNIGGEGADHSVNIAEFKSGILDRADGRPHGNRERIFAFESTSLFRIVKPDDRYVMQRTSTHAPTSPPT
jgi:hypothetical protein